MIWLLFVAQVAVVDAQKALADPNPHWIAPAELDGDPATREWVEWGIAGEHTNDFRALGIRPDGTLCRGEWFDPFPRDPGTFWYGYPDEVQGKTRIIVQSVDRYIEIAVTPCR